MEIDSFRVEQAVFKHFGARMDEFNMGPENEEFEDHYIRNVSFILSSFTDADLVALVDRVRLDTPYLIDGWWVGGLMDGRMSVNAKVVYDL
jgi:hypothetical protein